MKRCYFKSVAESPSREGKFMRDLHPEINFKKCLYKCSGFGDYGTCENYVLVEMDEAKIEQGNDELNFERLEEAI